MNSSYIQGEEVVCRNTASLVGNSSFSPTHSSIRQFCRVGLEQGGLPLFPLIPTHLLLLIKE